MGSPPSGRSPPSGLLATEPRGTYGGRRAVLGAAAPALHPASLEAACGRAAWIVCALPGPEGARNRRASPPRERHVLSDARLPALAKSNHRPAPWTRPQDGPAPPPDPARSSPVIFVVVQPLNRVSPCDPMAGSSPRLLCPAIFPQSGPQARPLGPASPVAPPLPAAPPPAVRQRLKSQSQVRSPRPRLPLTGPAPSLCSNRKPSLAKPRGNHTLQVAKLSPASEVKSFSRVRLFATPWTYPTRLLCPWNFPGKSTGVDCQQC